MTLERGFYFACDADPRQSGCYESSPAALTKEGAILLAIEFGWRLRVIHVDGMRVSDAALCPHCNVLMQQAGAQGGEDQPTTAPANNG